MSNGGRTDFNAFTHTELLKMVDSINTVQASESSGLLIKASGDLATAASALSTGIGNLEWKGQAADAFRGWADQVVLSTHGLSTYSLNVGIAMDDISVAAGEAKSLPPVPQGDIDFVNQVLADPNPTEQNAQAAVFAKANVSMQKQQAVDQMTKLASVYTTASENMDMLLPPEYPDPPLYRPPVEQSQKMNAPGGGGAGGGTGASRSPAPAPRGGTVSSTGPLGATPQEPGSVTALGAVGQGAPGGSLDLAGTGVLSSDAPTTTAGTGSGPLPPNSGPTGGAPGSPAPFTPPPVGNSQLPAGPGSKKASGIQGGTAEGMPSTMGGKPVTASGGGRTGVPNSKVITGESGASGAHPSTGPRSGLRGGPEPVEGGAPRSAPPGTAAEARPQGRGGMPTGGGAAAGPGGGRTVSSRSPLRTPGGTLGGTPASGLGNSPFSRGGSGLRTSPEAPLAEQGPGSTGRSGRPGAPGGAGTPSASESARRRRRAAYLEEDEETWSAHGRPVPPVVD